MSSPRYAAVDRSLPTRVVMMHSINHPIERPIELSLLLLRCCSLSSCTCGDDARHRPASDRQSERLLLAALLMFVLLNHM